MPAVAVPPVRQAARLKVISLGEPAVGKSCLIKRYCEDKFVSKHVATIGIDFGVKPVALSGHGVVRINFFDFAGGPEYFEVRNEFYKDASGAILVFDVASKSTLDALDRWLHEAEECGMQRPAMVLCGNKADGKKREVSEADARRWAGSHGGMAYFETSAKEGDNVHKMFEKLVCCNRQGLRELERRQGLGRGEGGFAKSGTATPPPSLRASPSPPSLSPQSRPALAGRPPCEQFLESAKNGFAR